LHHEGHEENQSHNGVEIGFYSRSLASIRGSKGVDWSLESMANREWTRMDANKSQMRSAAKGKETTVLKVSLFALCLLSS